MISRENANLWTLWFLESASYLTQGIFSVLTRTTESKRLTASRNAALACGGNDERRDGAGNRAAGSNQSADDPHVGQAQNKKHID